MGADSAASARARSANRAQEEKRGWLPRDGKNRESERMDDLVLIFIRETPPTAVGGGADVSRGVNTDKYANPRNWRVGAVVRGLAGLAAWGGFVARKRRDGRASLIEDRP
ncbi:hypothetical protein MishRS11D_13170 [Methylomagnum ishizawai]|nr:hypothetical protein MishRS11D_13170 [Methylomagnum ishizawai]